jgi:hypothetical protein
VKVLASMLLATTLFAALAACAHPAYRILVIRSHDAARLVRISAGPEFSADVYQIPKDALVVTRSGIAPFDGTIELLADTCEVLDSVDLSGIVGDVVVTFGPSPLGTAEPTAMTEDEVPRVELVDRCPRL